MFDPMTAGYDRIATMFSPDGRIHQIEYAREAVKHGSLVLAARNKTGLVLISEMRNNNPLYEYNEKIFQIDKYIFAAYSGLLADSQVLIDEARVDAQVQRIYYNEEPNLDVLGWKISNTFQRATQYGGLRPFGLSLLLAGFDQSGPSIHLIEPSGAKFKVNAIAIGTKEEEALEILKKEYTINKSLDELEALLKSIFERILGKNYSAEFLIIDKEKGQVRKEQINL